MDFGLYRPCIARYSVMITLLHCSAWNLIHLRKHCVYRPSLRLCIHIFMDMLRRLINCHIIVTGIVIVVVVVVVIL